MLVRKLLSSAAQRQAYEKAEAYRELLRSEAKIGGEVLGPVAPGARREFFCLDPHTWVWHEEWTDSKTHKRQTVTTRYDVRPSGILKVQDGRGYQRVNSKEANNLRRAAELYYQRVATELYHVVA